jgi:hypothetical protein
MNQDNEEMNENEEIDQNNGQKRRKTDLFFPHHPGPNTPPLNNLFTEIPFNFLFSIFNHEKKDYQRIGSNHKIIIKHSNFAQFQMGFTKILQHLHQIYKKTVIDLVDLDYNLSIQMAKGVLEHDKFFKSKYPDMDSTDPNYRNMIFTLNDYYTLNEANLGIKFRNINSTRIPRIRMRHVTNNILLHQNDLANFLKKIYDAFYEQSFEYNPGTRWEWRDILMNLHRDRFLEDEYQNTTLKGHFENSENFREQPMLITLTGGPEKYALSPGVKIINDIFRQLYQTFLNKLPVSLGYDAIEQRFIAPTFLRKMAHDLQGPLTDSGIRIGRDAARHIESYLMMGNGK